MPLLRNSPFLRRRTPKNLALDKPLYYLELTGEVFTNYDEFCYRIIQCNSLVWTCAETGRNDLTFSEALESESDAQKILSKFPEVLKVPTLFLASIAQSSDFQDLVSDVFEFMNSHFFVNETVEPKKEKKTWKQGKVFAVKDPKNSTPVKSPKKSLKPACTPPEWYVYVVNVTLEGNTSKTLEIGGGRLKRPEETFLSKDMLSAFLKQNAVQDARGIWVIKGYILREYNIQCVKFEDIFVGEPPVFSCNQNQQRQPENCDFNEVSAETRDRNIANRKNTSKNESSIKPKRGRKGGERENKSQGKESVQQNIEKYFISSRKSGNVQREQDCNEDEHSYKLKADIKEEPESDEAMLEALSGEDRNSSEEIKVVWSSGVRPRRTLNENIKRTKVVVDTGNKLSGMSPEKSDKIQSQSELLEKSSPKSSVLSTVDEKRKYKDEKKLCERLSGVQQSEEQSSLLKESNSAGKKLKQTRMFQRKLTQTNSSSGRKTKDAIHNITVKKKDPYRRKQKIVGTLKPWVQTMKRTTENSVSVVRTPKIETTQRSPKVKKRNWLEVQKEIEMREKAKKQEERLRKKAKKEEDKMKFAKFMKEWRKRRDDLLCEDLKPLPIPCDVNCRIPNELFGDFMVVLEFMHSFAALLSVKSSFPGGVTFDHLERALVETEITGPFNDIIHVMLLAIFELQIAEHEKTGGVPIAVDLRVDQINNQDLQEADPHSVAATGWCKVFQGVTLHDIPLTRNTISEVLRLHLLGSGGKAWDSNSKWLSQRSGFTQDSDDPGLWFRLENPSIILNMSQKHICELSAEEKLGVLCCLVNQILTYAYVRETIEERCLITRQAKARLRTLEIAEVKLQKEMTSKRIQEKKEAKKEALAKGSTNALTTSSQGNTGNENQKLEKEMSKLKADIQKKAPQILPLLMAHQLLPIGSDRAHRKFWMFSSLPGLFVECNPFEIGSCLPQATPRAQELSDTLAHVRKLFEEESNSSSSDKENDSSDKDESKPQSTSHKKMLGEQNSSLGALNDCEQNNKDTSDVKQSELVCTASESCPVHHPPHSKSHWYFFANQEDVTILLACLNERGIRESALRRVLVQGEQRITNSIGQCPTHKLNPSKFQVGECEPRKSTRLSSGFKSESDSKYPPGTPVNCIMENTIREFILELESKIVLGGVGSLNIWDRMVWRTAIENGEYDKQCDKLVWGFKMHKMSKMTKPSKVSLEPKFVQVNEQSELESMSIQEKPYSIPSCDSMDTDPSYDSEDDRNDCAKSRVGPSVKEDSILCDGDSGVDEGPVERMVLNRGNDRVNSGEDCLTNTQEIEQSCDNSKQTDEDLENDNTIPSSIPLPCSPVVKTLASAILQLGQSIDPKFLQKPLAGNVKSGKQAKIKYWEVSLMNSINFSQLFIHYWTLENSINWSKSTFNAPCCVCRKRINANKMLLCDMCNRGYHIYCLKPQLKDIPQGDWFCPSCKSAETESKRAEENNATGGEIIPLSEETDDLDDVLLECRIRSQLSVNKATGGKKRKAMSDDVDDVDDVLLKHRIKARKVDNDGEMCSKCTQTGMLIFCSCCNVGYHPKCINSRRKFSIQQKENWMCELCIADEKAEKSSSEVQESTDEGIQECVESSKESSDSEDSGEEESADEYNEESADEHLEKSSNDQLEDSADDSSEESADEYLEEDSDFIIEDRRTPIRQRRGCASATIAKIACFAKRLRSKSWEDDGERVKISDDELQENTSIRRRSRKSTYASENFPLDNALLQDLLTEMLRHNDAWPFLRPVRKAQVPDYHKIIKRPMDLGTVKYKLNTAVYNTNKAFVADILLIFRNCFMFNSPDIIEYKCADSMNLFFRRRCQEVGLVLPEDA